jgi:hypothetical protein
MEKVMKYSTTLYPRIRSSMAIRKKVSRLKSIFRLIEFCSEIFDRFSIKFGESKNVVEGFGRRMNKKRMLRS